MMIYATLIALSIAIAAPVQTAPVTPAPATPAPATPVAPAATAKYTLDTPLAELVADPAAKAVLDKDLPGLTTIESFESFKGASLNQVAPFSNGALTEAKLAQVAIDLAAIK